MWIKQHTVTYVFPHEMQMTQRIQSMKLYLPTNYFETTTIPGRPLFSIYTLFILSVIITTAFLENKHLSKVNKDMNIKRPFDVFMTSNQAKLLRDRHQFSPQYPIKIWTWLLICWHHSFRKYLVAGSAPRHYLNKCSNIVNWILGNKLQWNLNRNCNTFIQEEAFESVICKMVSILPRHQCVRKPISFNMGFSL